MLASILACILFLYKTCWRVEKWQFLLYGLVFDASGSKREHLSAPVWEDYTTFSIHEYNNFKYSFH